MLEWELELLNQALWPQPVAGTTALPLSSVQLWPTCALGRRTIPGASGSLAIIMVDSDDECNNSDDGVLGTDATNCRLALGGRERRAGAPRRQQDHRDPKVNPIYFIFVQKLID